MAVNSAISATATVTDPGVLDTHTAMWNWGDGSTSRGTVSETGGSGSVQAIHTYTAAGVYTVALTFTDDDGLAVAALPFQYIVVYDPSAGFATGSGWFTSPAGAYSANPSLTGKLHFGFNARYQTGTSVPSGSGRLIFPAANLTFQLSSYQWLVVSGASVQLEGTGTINGAGDYTLLISAVAGSQPGGGGTDLIRLMLWDSATGQIIYDSQPGAPETAAPTTPLGAGKLSVH
jgi:hypothetical protein